MKRYKYTAILIGGFVIGWHIADLIKAHNKHCVPVYGSTMVFSPGDNGQAQADFCVEIAPFKKQESAKLKSPSDIK